MGKNKGLIQIYTGDGKGKTTAAIGLAVRAAGAGYSVAFLQFFKKGEFVCNEEKILKKIKNIKFIKFNQQSPLFNKKIDILTLNEQIKKDLDYMFELIYSKKYDIIILDEFTYIFKLNLNKKEIIKKIKEKPQRTEIIITGRDADKSLIKIADLVSDIKKVKHYFNKKIFARRGIDF